MKTKVLIALCTLGIVAIASLNNALAATKHQPMRLDAGTEYTISLEPQERIMVWRERAYCMYSSTQYINDELKEMRRVRYNNQRHVSQLFPRKKLQDRPYAPTEATLVIIKNPGPAGAERLEFTIVKRERKKHGEC